jgi:Ferroportin1 (FPN1)
MFGPAIGRWIDRTPRLRAVRTSVVSMDIAIVCGAALFYYGLTQNVTGWHRDAIFAGICFLGVIASMGHTSNDLAILRDWIVCMSDGDKEFLTRKYISLLVCVSICVLVLSPRLNAHTCMLFHISLDRSEFSAPSTKPCL